MLEDIDEVLKTMQIEGEQPINDEIQPIETFVEFESATNFKGFEAPHNIVLGMDDQLLCSDVQTEVGQIYDELRRLFEMFQRNDNKLTLNVKYKKFIHSRQMTLHDMFKQRNMNPDFCQKICTLNQDAYINECVLKWEITVPAEKEVEQGFEYYKTLEP